jgi:hypothetical protein
MALRMMRTMPLHGRPPSKSDSILRKMEFFESQAKIPASQSIDRQNVAMLGTCIMSCRGDC